MIDTEVELLKQHIKRLEDHIKRLEQSCDRLEQNNTQVHQLNTRLQQEHVIFTGKKNRLIADGIDEMMNKIPLPNHKKLLIDEIAKYSVTLRHREL